MTRNAFEEVPYTSEPTTVATLGIPRPPSPGYYYYDGQHIFMKCAPVASASVDSTVIVAEKSMAPHETYYSSSY